MAVIQNAVLTFLAADVSLIATLTGGLYNRPLRNTIGQGGTPNAFAAEGAGGVPRLRPAGVVTDGGEVPAPGGEVINGTDTFPQVHFYAPATATGKAALDTADERVRTLLHGRRLSVAGVGLVTFSALERARVLDSDEFPGNVQTFRRYRGERVRGEGL